MKILMTGVTARMVGSTRVAIDYLTVGQLVKMILKKLGHEVDWRAVEPGDDTSGYDLYFVGWAPLLSMGSGRAPGCAWVMHQHPEKSVIYAEDWSFGGFGKINQGIVDGQFKAYLKWRNFQYEAKYIDVLKDVVRTMTPSHPCPWPVMVPMYGWGDHGLAFENNLVCDIWDYDPTCLVPEVPINFVKPRDKAKTWVLSQLSDQTAWLKKLALSWPVESYGNKRRDQPVLDEPELLQVYAKNWGMLSSKYAKMTGSGWWRVRYLHATWVGAVMHCDILDGEKIGPSYTVPVQDVEKMSHQQLTILSENQAHDFRLHLPTEAQLLETMRARLASYEKINS